MKIKSSKGYAYYDKKTGEIFPWAMETKYLNYHLEAATETQRIQNKQPKRFQQWLKDLNL